MIKRLCKTICIILLFSSIYIFPASIPPDSRQTITDDAGRRVVLPDKVRRVVSLSPSNTEILFAIGAGDMVCGVTDYCNFPPETKSLPKVGGFSDISIEKIAELRPDIVLASHYHISKLVPALESLKFAVIVLNPEKVTDVFNSILVAGRAVRKEAESEKLCAGLREQYNALSAKAKLAEKVSVYWELSDDYWTIGKGSYLDDLISEAGGKNIASHLDAPWLQLNAEFILNEDPAFIFLADHPYGIKTAELLKRPGWDSLVAVKRKKVIEVSEPENDIVSRPGPRVIMALEYIMRRIHPELF